MRKMRQSRQQDDNEIENPMMKRLRRLTVPVTQESCPLSISTRAIGFMLPEVTSYLNIHCYDDCSSDNEDNERDKIEAPLSAMYRVCLAQLEAKVHLATSNQILCLNPSIYDPSSPYDLQPSSLLYSIMDDITFRYYPESPVSVIINSIGNVETNGMHYVPKFTKKTTPLNLRISNLRKYCEDMANPDTSAEDRKIGYQLNPIPNAKWDDEDGLEFVKLNNPDEIIAAGYDQNSFSKDLETMRKYLRKTQAEKRLKYPMTVDYNGFGNPGILASTDVKPERSLRLNESNDQRCIESTFWSREHLAADSWSIGVLTLAGEVLDPIGFPHRLKTLSAENHDGEWYRVCSGFV